MSCSKATAAAASGSSIELSPDILKSPVLPGKPPRSGDSPIALAKPCGPANWCSSPLGIPCRSCSNPSLLCPCTRQTCQTSRIVVPILHSIYRLCIWSSSGCITGKFQNTVLQDQVLTLIAHGICLSLLLPSLSIGQATLHQIVDQIIKTFACLSSTRLLTAMITVETDLRQWRKVGQTLHFGHPKASTAPIWLEHSSKGRDRQSFMLGVFLISKWRRLIVHHLVSCSI